MFVNREELELAQKLLGRKEITVKDWLDLVLTDKYKEEKEKLITEWDKKNEQT